MGAPADAEGILLHPDKVRGRILYAGIVLGRAGARTIGAARARSLARGVIQSREGGP
jgi:hypothetical protein